MSAFGFGFFSSVFPVLFSLGVVAFFVAFIVTLVRSGRRWHKNNNSPRLTVEASVVTKRTSVSHSHNASTHTHSSSTWYYVTFQVESGDRMELSVSGYEYGMLVEGDRGRLSFQGTRFLNFERL